MPRVAGELQAPAKDAQRAGTGSYAYATVLEKLFDENRDRVGLDLTNAYRVYAIT
jgi:hypothetical protein